MKSDQFLQDEFAWVEEDDRFDLGLCFTLVHSTDVEAVLEVFDSANPRKLRKPTEMGTEEWLDSLADEDALAMRHAASVGGWTWILEELSIAAILPPLPERLSAAFGTSITVQWDVNMLSAFVLAREGVVERRFELGRIADPSDRTSLEGYLDEELGLDWEQWVSAGVCLQARIVGVTSLSEMPIEPMITETCT
ncbi:hypothetical protein M2405_004167 [Rhodococcus erythropolis]|uniref:DUF6461 domain-containing protein n=1 Tax=Rhodococcus erythropolis TaxID=1833 RepID=UPI002168DE90|nr:DUF6461 domain-containing protein [Rhodococcus erythropolis]MCS4255864.1 hypothetical protein [Rhodococcus erythropolis]MCW2425381.1 hypothetical protein [Rhodococcus erythropolis]